MAFFVITINKANGMLLEQIIKEETFAQTFSNKKIGYYTGSFDPFHKGHEEVIKLVLKQNLCDYIFVVPLWGGDNHKVRIPISKRLLMLHKLYEKDPKVIFTYLNSREVQQLFTIHLKNIKNVRNGFLISDLNIEFIGIIGSDTALWLLNSKKNGEEEIYRKKMLDMFMRGIEVSNEYANNSFGNIICLPVNKFIIALRNNDILSMQDKIAGRPIMALIKSNTTQTISSTQVKKFIKEDKNTDEVLNPIIGEIIRIENLYY